MEDIVLLLLALIIPAIAQLYVMGTYSKYQKKKNSHKLTGYDVARKILDNNGLESLYIVETTGKMSDHYDPTRKTVKLSNDVYNGDSIASLAIAAHECGHAIQDKQGYVFMKIRSAIFPVVHLGTQLAYFILLVGLFLEIMNLVWAAIILVGLGLIFQIITLPVEFDASKRAKVELEKLKLADSKSIDGTNNMLRAAALTYVAGVISSALNILRLVLRYTSRD